MVNSLIRILSNKRAYAIILGVIAIVVTTQEYLLHYFNNFIIFIQSFPHLIHHQNLYIPYPKEYGDVFLYSPTFALFMAPFYYLPAWLSLAVWTSINCFAIYFALTMLPGVDSRKRILIFLIIVMELVTSLQNTQTSAMLAAFMALAFIFFERKKVFWAAFFIVLASFIKVYCLAAAVLFFLYPRRAGFILYMVLWTVIFAILPVIVIPFKQLVIQYQNWLEQILAVHKSEDTGINPNLIKPPLSVMGWLKTWFHLNPPAIYIQSCGLVLLLLPLFRFRLYKDLRFKYFLLSSVLIFCMIFNHIAESPSYIIAVLGVAIWFAWEKKNAISWILMVLAFVFTVILATDIFPEYIRHNYGIPYVWKAVPCILIWFWIQYRMLCTRDFEIEFKQKPLLGAEALKDEN